MEFEQVLESSGKKLEDLKSYVGDHPELRKPLYPIPHRKGVTGVAANFALHVSDLMDGKTRIRRAPGFSQPLAHA
jgi:hypothetical protein